MRYRNRKVIGKQYGQYKDNVNAIRQEFGLEPMADKQNNYKQANTWGANGIELYVGDKDKLKGHSYNPQNIYGIKPVSDVYAVNKEGDIIKKLDKEQVIPYLKKKGQEPSGVNALRKMNAEESQIENFIKKINDLKFRYINFEADSILYIAATVNGEALAYVNPNLKRAVNDIDINPQDFIQIANERYRKDTNEMRFTYKQLVEMISESVTRILSEHKEK